MKKFLTAAVMIARLRRPMLSISAPTTVAEVSLVGLTEPTPVLVSALEPSTITTMAARYSPATLSAIPPMQASQA